MKHIVISDATMKQFSKDAQLSFADKVNIAKFLDKIGVDFIELNGIKNARIDSLLIKSVVSAVNDSKIAVPVELNDSENIEKTWKALKDAKNPRLQVLAATSPEQKEYIFHKKPEAMLEAIKRTVSDCKSLCPDVEFIAEDATRSEPSFLSAAIDTAINAGATTVTLCDTAGVMLPSEFAEFIRKQYTSTPKLSEVSLGIRCSNNIAMADACSVIAVAEGATQIRTVSHTPSEAYLLNIAHAFRDKSAILDGSLGIKTEQLSKIITHIDELYQTGISNNSFASDRDENKSGLTEQETMETIKKVTDKLGYNLSDKDLKTVYDDFMRIARKKGTVSYKELDAIIDTSALLVPPTYKLDSFVITSGNTISATAHIKLIYNDSIKDGVSVGDGPIDAAFKAIENITERHYDLYDFQLQAVTGGREAIGQTSVKLLANEKFYSAIGISTDIVGAGIRAYISALNKIIYDEQMNNSKEES